MTAVHRIGELLFNLAFESPAMGIARSEELRSLVVDKLLPLMETVFDQFGGDDVVRQIDKLVVDVGNVTEAELPAALVAGLRAALEQALHDEDEEGDPLEPPLGIAGSAAPVRRAGRVSRHHGDVDVLLAFLAGGTMPWHVDASEPASHETLLARVLKREHGIDAFLRALAASPHRDVMLTRLARQFAPAQLEQVLRKMRPGHADAMLSQLAVLQELLQDAALTRTVQSGAMHAAWEAAFAAALENGEGPQQSTARALTERALSGLAEQRREDLAAAATRRLGERENRRGVDATDSDVVHLLRQITGTVFPALAAEPGAFPIGEEAIREMPGETSRQTVADSDAPQTSQTPQEQQELPSTMAPIRNRVTSALMGGKAGDVYDEWHALQDGQPDLLRSAILHYGGYGEIREKMASAFPLSLLLDMEALLSPEAAVVTARVWSDEGLRNRFGEDAAAQWSHWRRGWWRGAVSYLLPLARARGDTASSAAAASFSLAAYVAAALDGAGATAADEDVSVYVTALAQGGDAQPRHAPAQRSAAQTGAEQEEIEPRPEILPAVSQPPSLTSLFDAIRNGGRPLRTSAFGVEQLEQWVGEAAREPSFYRAIADHAAMARDRRAYYAQVLQALALNRIVDLEEFAAAEDAAEDTPVQEARQQLATDALPAPIDTPGPSAPGYPIEIETAPGSAGIADERDKAQLVGRLAKALMKGDPAPLYGDWDILLHKHAALLREALRHYGIRDDILQRIALSFPESMLYDMAVLLAPAAMPAWRKLRDQAAWTAALEAVSAPAGTAPAPDASALPVMEGDPVFPTPEVLASWKRQLWKAALRQLLQGEHRDFGAIHALASSLAEDAELVRLPWQRRVLMRWADLSVHASIDPSWTAADMDGLIEARILAQGTDDAQRQQRQTFLQAIRTQAPSPAPDRVRYFKAVLQALLQEKMLDLEEIAEASKGGDENIAPLESGRASMPENDSAGGKQEYAGPPMQESAGNASDRPDQESLAYADFLISPNFPAGLALPSGLIAWLNMAIDTAAPELMPVLAKLSGHPEAVARLLEIVPASSRQTLAALAPYSALQVQRMRRYAGDVADMFAEQHGQLSAAELARFEWRFLVPHLFAPDRIFEPARFTGEFVAFLSRESGLPVPAALTSRLRGQMGVAVALPRALQRTDFRAATADKAAEPNPNASPSSSSSAGRNDSRPARMAGADDDAVLQTSAGILVANAGMVLTWPFLSRAWEVLELTREGKFVDDAAAQRAAWLLEFAVNEQTAVPEYQLTLNKLLCGIPLQAPIVPEIEVTQQERELVEQLLTVMISHWSAIGNTSIQGLRETFLRREGYLSRKEDAWRLEVPKRTFDMLLDKLPWSISTIRLPWMETILWVEWT